MRFILFFSLVWLLPLSGQGQTYFSRRYTNPTVGAQTSFGSIAVNDSGFAAVGVASNYPALGQRSLCLYFVDSLGNQVRTRYYPAATPGSGDAFQRLPDGGYLLPSQVLSTTFPLKVSTKLWRFDALGDTLWTRKWTRERAESPYSLCVLPDGGCAVVGALSVGPPAASGMDMVLTRVDAAGQIRWWRTYHQSVQDDCYSVALCRDGGFLLGGTAYDLQRHDTFVVKTDSLGQEQWRRTFGTPAQTDWYAQVCALRDGTYIVAANVGTRRVNGTQYLRHTVYHLDSAGQTLWTRQLGPEGDSNVPHTVHELADGSIVVGGGQSRLDSLGMSQGVVYKLCPDGDSVWYRSFLILPGAASHNYMTDLRPTADGGFVGAGFLFTYPPDTGSSDGWVFRLDSAGYLVAGGAPVTRSCRPLVGVAQPEAEGLAGATVWPNPAPDGRFTLALPAGRGRRTLRVTDALGREVWRGEAAEGNTPLPLGGLAPGLYWLRATGADGRGQSWKLVR